MSPSVNFYLSVRSFPSFEWSPHARVDTHWGPLQIYVLFSVCSSLTSSPDLWILSIINPTFSALPLQFKETLACCLVLLSAPLSGNFLKTVRSAKSRAFLFACQHLGLLLLLPDAYVLKNFYFNCFICFMIVFYDCFRSKLNPVPVISFYYEQKYHLSVPSSNVTTTDKTCYELSLSFLHVTIY